jgi:hypothetical protein
MPYLYTYSIKHYVAPTFLTKDVSQCPTCVSIRHQHIHYIELSYFLKILFVSTCPCPVSLSVLHRLNINTIRNCTVPLERQSFVLKPNSVYSRRKCSTEVRLQQRNQQRQVPYSRSQNLKPQTNCKNNNQLQILQKKFNLS